ncbi:unnamed protein product [Brassica oleracea var. botrytis]|uniref:(rape) hypothetical protein n=1 Tax=Brassica napus TaxID=3708 RepID=A0A078FLD1_BRANA|nr:unnamed protein product [Brassica napus]CDY13926.1 BnaC09g39000D [Brassica napus]
MASPTSTSLWLRILSATIHDIHHDKISVREGTLYKLLFAGAR